MPTKKTVKKVTKKVLKKAVLKKKAVKKVVKKTTKKKPVKKTIKKVTKKVIKKATKKVIKKTANKSLVFANEQTSFWVSNGKILNSMIALRDALDEMEKEVYQYHAGNAQNDFANWVAVVLADQKCASALEKAKTPLSAKTTVVRHLRYYSI
jgi:hypothetical protein